MIERKKGAAVILVIIMFLGISIAVVGSVTFSLITELRLYRNLAQSKYAYVAAENGAEDVFYRIIAEKQLSSSETIVLNGATSTTQIQTISPTQYDIYTVGEASDRFRNLFLRVSKSADANFYYGAQVGEGGITMTNNAIIDGLGLADGDIYSNGSVVGAANTAVRGDVIVSERLQADTVASSTVCSSDEVVGQTNPKIDHAQSFVVATTSTDSLAKVSLYIKRTGNPANATIRITADNGGVPATTALAAQTLSYSSVGTTYGWVDVIFSAPAFLNPGVTYWIVFDSGQHNTRYWTWCRDGDGYAAGVGSYKQDWSTSGSWTALSGDLNFKLYWGGGVSLLSNIPDIDGTARAAAIQSSTIDGDAYYQTISGSTVAGTSYPGSPTSPHVPLPFTSAMIAGWKDDATDGGTYNGDYTINGTSVMLGPRKINGNLLLDNNAILTVTGTIYVTGNLVTENNTQIKCHADYLTKSCMIIVDGYIRVSNNGTFDGSGAAESFIMLLSTKAGCVGPGTIISGCTTNNSAIAIENNVDSALFYAGESMIDISNNAIVTAVIGYKLNLSNNTGILYDSFVSDLTFMPSATNTTGGWNANLWNEY